MSALLIRDLAQVASPAGSAAPLRGSALREIEVTTDAYVLCKDGRIAATGSMRRLEPIGGDVHEIDEARDRGEPTPVDLVDVAVDALEPAHAARRRDAPVFAEHVGVRRDLDLA